MIITAPSRAATNQPSDAATKRPTFFQRRYNKSRLSSRITLLFGLSSLVLALLVCAITYYSTRSSIVGQFVTSAETTATYNGSQVRAQLLQHIAGPIVVNYIDEATSDSSSLLYYNKQWSYTGRLSIFGPQDIPKDLQTLVADNTAGEQIFTLPATSDVLVAVGQSVTQLPHGTARYFEVFPMTQAQNELQSLLSVLIGAAALTTMIGFLLGRWAARRTMRPLREVSQVALKISEGQLNARIETGSGSDLAMLANSFNRMVDLLQDRLEREERFASDVSHELRSPLTTLASSISILESRIDELPERSAQAVSLLSQEIRRFQRMVANLLEMARIDAGSSDLRTEEVLIDELVVRSLARSSSLPAKVEIDPSLDGRVVMADKRRFERIIANVLENAERYAGGVTRVALTRGRTRDGGGLTVRIILEDDGPGIPDAEKQRIFDRFARGANTAGHRGMDRGTGLGLALVREHVRLHDGTIWVEDNTPNGARFIIELPLFTRTDEDEDEEQAQ